jgi:glycyl-tRNA synthetase
MVAAERLSEPLIVDKVIAEPNKRLLGPRFKLDQKAVITKLEALDGEELDTFKATLESSGKATLPGTTFEITSELVTFKSEKRTIFEQKYTPGVIEPSFGIGRILYAVLEHSFSQRTGSEQRCVMSFKPAVAPVKVGVYKLMSNNTAFDPIVQQLNEGLLSANISTRVDSSSGSVGRRYARSDELGIPFGVTVDFQSLLDNTVTLRDRDSMAQVGEI